MNMRALQYALATCCLLATGTVVASEFDTGTVNATDAFGQLLEIGGGSGSVPMPSGPAGLQQGEAFRAPPPNPRNLPRSSSRRLPAAVVRKPSASRDSAVNAMVTGMIVMSLLSAMDNADANARAEAEAARARELEEERLRQERLRRAAGQRADWQDRDSAVSQVLTDALRGGTAFFGQGTADPAAADWLATPVTATPATPAALPEPGWPSAAGALLNKGASGLRELVTDGLKGIGKAIVPKQIQNAEKALDYMDRTNTFIGDTFTQLDPELLAKAAVSSDESYTRQVLGRGDALLRQGQTLAMGEDGPSAAEMEAIYRTGAGDTLSARDFGSLTWDRMKGWLVDNRLRKMGFNADD